MNQIYALVGPRGWALVSLAGGALLASPFLRPSATDEHPDVSAPVSAAAAPFLSTASGAFGGGMTTQRGVGSASTEATSVAAVSELRTVAGKLPSTLAAPPAKLPDWVPTPSQLDRLIARPEPVPSHDQAIARAEAVVSSKPREFRAWRSPSPGRGGEQPSAMSWNAPQAQPGYRPLLTHSPAASPWGADRVLEVSPAPVANNALASNRWPDEQWSSEERPSKQWPAEQLPTDAFQNGRASQIAGISEGHASSAPTTSAPTWPLTSSPADPLSESAGERKSAFTATLRRTGLTAQGSGGQPSAAGAPGQKAEHPVLLPELPGELTDATAKAKSPRRFVYQPGLNRDSSFGSDNRRNK